MLIDKCLVIYDKNNKNEYFSAINEITDFLLEFLIEKDDIEKEILNDIKFLVDEIFIFLKSPEENDSFIFVIQGDFNKLITTINKKKNKNGRENNKIT